MAPKALVALSGPFAAGMEEMPMRVDNPCSLQMQAEEAFSKYRTLMIEWAQRHASVNDPAQDAKLRSSYDAFLTAFNLFQGSNND